MTLMIPRPALRLVPNTRHPNNIVEVISYAAGECALGRVLSAGDGQLPHTELSPVKARIALLLELMH